MTARTVACGKDGKGVKKILVIGIGAGDPDYLTVQAIEALNRVDVFFVLDKGSEKAALAELRREICRRFITREGYRFVDATSPERAQQPADYRASVLDNHREKQALFARLIEGEMRDGEVGAFLVWGDPALYDSTVRILHALIERGTPRIEFEVIPGITSIQALAAKHRVPLNRIGQPFAVTTGRRLADGFPPGMDSAAVMLDGGTAFKRLADPEIDIFWGAYVGMPQEILIAGKLGDVADEIERVRAEARAAHGWIMDSYILHRGGDEPDHE